MAVAGQAAAILFVRFFLGFDLPTVACLAFIALSVLLNVTLRLRYPARYRLSPTFGDALLVYDLLQLSALLYLTGGLLNPFAFLIVAPVTVSAATLRPRQTIALGLMAIAVASVLVFWHKPLPWWPGEVFDLPKHYKFGIWASIVCGLTFIGLYSQRLAREARQMANALAATENVLARENRLHALDGLAAAAAHELGTPLSTIAVITKELERDTPTGSPLRDDISLLQEQTQRCREILQKLTSDRSDTDPIHTALSLSNLINEAVIAHQGRGPAITVSLPDQPKNGDTGSSEPITHRNPGVLYGLGNIVENAVQFANSEVLIGAHWDTDYVEVSVSDDGPGFARSVIESVGEPYVTTRPSWKSPPESETGLGLGFFIAKTLLGRAGATVEASNLKPPRKGARVVIRWPRSAFEFTPPMKVSDDERAGRHPMPGGPAALKVVPTRPE